MSERARVRNERAVEAAMSDTKRLTDDEVLDAYGAIRLAHPRLPAVRADHLQAREDVKRLVDEIRGMAPFRWKGTGPWCWCPTERGQSCFNWKGEPTGRACIVRNALLAEVAPVSRYARKVDPQRFGVVRVEAGPRPGLEFMLPVRLVSVANLREHWRVKSMRTGNHRGAAALMTRLALKQVPGVRPPVLVKLTRVQGPRGRALDDDNLAHAFKAVRDGVAKALGVDDGDKKLVRWEYTPEERGSEWAVRIRIEAMP